MIKKKNEISRRLYLLFAIFALFLFLAASADTIVYITKTGGCYHISSCRYLKKS